MMIVTGTVRTTCPRAPGGVGGPSDYSDESELVLRVSGFLTGSSWVIVTMSTVEITNILVRWVPGLLSFYTMGSWFSICTNRTTTVVTSGF